MDGASNLGDPNMGADPMGGDPNMGGAPAGDPMGGDPGMGGDPSMGSAPAGDPMGGDPGMGDDPMNGPDMSADTGDGDDSTMSIINQLSDTDREAVRAYAESMLNRDETQAGTEPTGEPTDAPMDAPAGGDQEQPMMESVTFTKGQLEKINEVFGDNQNDFRDKKPLNKREEKVVSKKSPFAPKNFK
jgi:hypothetical protein